MRKNILLITATVSFSLLRAQAAQSTVAPAVVPPLNAAQLKPRIILQTDVVPNVRFNEVDDLETAVRFLVYADQLQIEGFLATQGYNQGEYYKPENIKELFDRIDAYEKDLPNLMKRSNQTGFLDSTAEDKPQKIGYWPSADYLRSRTMLGSQRSGFAVIGETNDSPGSNLIIKMAERADERPLWVVTGGGDNTLAQAIWRVQKTRTPEQLKAFLHKIRTYIITDQDKIPWDWSYTLSSTYWMRKQFGKDLMFLWDETQHLIQAETGKRRWAEYAKNIQGHGNLGALYTTARFGVEGDTPDFLYLVPNGLSNPEIPTQCGWGGYFFWGLSPDAETHCYINHVESQKVIPPNAKFPPDPTGTKYGNYFYQATFNDFAARMDWAKDGKGNRNPVVIVKDDSTLNILTLRPASGSSVTLDASRSSDPDGDQLAFKWWALPEAGTYPQAVAITNPTSSRITIDVPADSAGKSFHVICEVTDNGTPNLTGYRRIIFEPTDKKN
jgi:hypothetical protein